MHPKFQRTEEVQLDEGMDGEVGKDTLSMRMDGRFQIPTSLSYLLDGVPMTITYLTLTLRMRMRRMSLPSSTHCVVRLSRLVEIRMSFCCRTMRR